MGIIELIGGIFDLWSSWRFYICVAITVPIAIALHKIFPDQTWIWLVSAPIVLFGLVAGFYWEHQSGKSR
jgi:hypothetical protein